LRIEDFPRQDLEVREGPAEVAQVPVAEFTLAEPREVPQMPGYDQETFTVPDGYGETRIVLQVRDPFWMHVYWEIAQETEFELSRSLGALRDTAAMALRVHDVTGIQFDGTNSRSTTDIRVSNLANNWYLNVQEPDRSYCVDLGLLTEDAHFHLIARSNVVHTPRAGVSGVVDEEWATIRELELAVPSVPGTRPGSPEFIKTEEWARVLAAGSGGITGVSSPYPGPPPPGRREFWLVADTEVIVYGATEPGSTVTIGGSEVQLSPDGRFSVRYALPPGDHHVGIRAVSADGMVERSITWRVSRTRPV
jgi:hypothetical protein